MLSSEHHDLPRVSISVGAIPDRCLGDAGGYVGFANLLQIGPG
jgi:hypothetical protein